MPCCALPCRTLLPPLPSSVLTTDVALLHDESYLKWVKLYAEEEGALRHAFQHGEPGATMRRLLLELEV